jgi:hypothetical protein
MQRQFLLVVGALLFAIVWPFVRAFSWIRSLFVKD